MHQILFATIASLVLLTSFADRAHGAAQSSSTEQLAQERERMEKRMREEPLRRIAELQARNPEEEARAAARQDDFRPMTAVRGALGPINEAVGFPCGINSRPSREALGDGADYITAERMELQTLAARFVETFNKTIAAEALRRGIDVCARVRQRNPLEF